MNKDRETRAFSAEDKLPEPTGDKLPESTRKIDPTLLGKLFGLHWGMVPLGCLVFRRGTILDQDCRGRLLGKFVYSVGEY